VPTTRRAGVALVARTSLGLHPTIEGACPRAAPDVDGAGTPEVMA
jgi:hypothetical protein